MSAISLSGVSFHYDAPYVSVFDDLTLSIDPRWKSALVGRNGRGKTTLLRLIHGDLEPTRGSVVTTIRTRLFPYEPTDRSAPCLEVLRDSIAPFRDWERRLEELSDRDDPDGVRAYAELLDRYQVRGGFEIDARIEREIVDVGLDRSVLGRAFETLSGGERTRALIAMLFLERDGFPLIDEPTNHLDLDGRELLADYLNRHPGFILVSHDRHFLDRCVDHVVSINPSDVRLHHCGFAEWQRAMERDELHERRRHVNLTREIRSLKTGARRRRSWSDAKEKEKIGGYDKGRIGHLAAKQMKRALAIERRTREKIEEREALLRNVEKPRRLLLRTEKRSPSTLLRVQDVAASIDGQVVLDGVSLTVCRGDRLAIVGPNGAGKTTLLRCVAGTLDPSGGRIVRPGHIRVEWSFQHPLWSEGPLREHLRGAGLEERVFRNVMGSFGVSGEIFDRPLETFSRGERKKVDLCRSFLSPAHLLIWDEPMNYIDLVTRGEIEEEILRGQPTMLFVEHDRWFVERIATDVLALPARPVGRR